MARIASFGGLIIVIPRRLMQRGCWHTGGECSTVHTRKGAVPDASIPYEVPCQEGDEGCQERNHEEW